MQKFVIVPLTIATLLLAGCAGNASHTPVAAASTATQSCKAVSEAEIAGLFDRWNRSLLTLDPHKVGTNYAKESVLLPTLSNTPRLTPEAKEDYFQHFLTNHPSGAIDSRTIQLGCNSAVDIGLYTFTFGTTGAKVPARYTFTYTWDGQQWLISTHHSSLMPEVVELHP